MPMNFEEAEARFRELQSRVQRGETISRAEYEEQVSQLAVQDRNGVLWEINPRTGKWMYFDGAEWVSGTPPGHDTSAVIPVPGRGAAASTPATPAPTVAPSAPPSTPSAPPPSAPTPPPVRPVTPAVPPRPVTPPSTPPPAGARTSPESLKPYVRPSDKTPAGAPPPPPTSPPPRGGSQAGRTSPLAMFGPNREWVPLAIGAVVLLLCAILLFVGGQFAIGMLGGGTKTTTPTRIAVATLPVTAIPTRVALPTLPPPTSTPVPVLAKVTETKVNVRAGPTTKDKIISSVKKNDQLTLVGRNSDSSWFQINIAGSATPGWIFAQTLQIASGDPNTLPVAGPVTPTPKPGVAPAVQPTATLAPLGSLPTPTPKAYP